MKQLLIATNNKGKIKELQDLLKDTGIELITPAQARRIDEYFIAELKRLGSDFPYEEFCRLAPGVTVSAPAQREAVGA